ncbi:MAG: efflux RND transporter periplasmic adaptor subunit [Spirochaetales bacterium]|nr:efflux RND transporter periplasmic adaptor subunit [Spirochaetales bacterium]
MVRWLADMGIKRVLRSLLTMLSLAVILLLVFFFIRRQGKEEEPLDYSPVVASYPVLGVVEESLHYPGTLMPEKTIVVVPKVSGKVERVYVEKGRYVHQDELLVDIDSRIVELQMEQAYAAYQAADAQYRQAVGGVRDEELRNTEALVAQAEKDVELARTNLDRIRRLYESGAATRQEYESAENRIQNAEVQLENAKRSLTMMRQGALDTELDMARSNMAAMRAQYELAKIQYENARVSAPVSGIVADVMIDAGNMVGSGTPVAAIIVDDPIYVEIQVPEKYYGRIRPNLEDITVRVSPIAYPDHQPFPGTITSISPVIDPQTRTFSLEAAVENQGMVLRPGMYVNVEVVISSRADGILLPVGAVVSRKGGDMVFLVVEGNSQHAEMRPVVKGLEARGMVEIKEGINPEDLIIVEGNAFLEDGQAVRVVKE